MVKFIVVPYVECFSLLVSCTMSCNFIGIVLFFFPCCRSIKKKTRPQGMPWRLQSLTCRCVAIVMTVICTRSWPWRTQSDILTGNIIGKLMRRGWLASTSNLWRRCITITAATLESGRQILLTVVPMDRGIPMFTKILDGNRRRWPCSAGE